MVRCGAGPFLCRRPRVITSRRVGIGRNWASHFRSTGSDCGRRRHLHFGFAPCPIGLTRPILGLPLTRRSTRTSRMRGLTPAATGRRLASFVRRHPVSSRTTNCSIHGPQGIGLVCVHIAHAVDRGERVGFFWSPPSDTARPDAWCSECETALVSASPGLRDAWVLHADFKVFCAECWDEAKSVCGGFSNASASGA